MSAVPRKLGGFFYRDMLSSQGQAFYDSILDRFLRQDYSGIIRLSARAPATAAPDCLAAYEAVRDDHPECFYLGPQCRLIQDAGQMMLKCHMLYSEQTISRIQLQLRKLICQLVRGTADLTPVERECLVYERIAKRLSYVNNHDFSDHNVVGPLLMSCGVCEGYNALLMLCLRRLGIPCIKAYGKSAGNTRHCWSLVWVQGTPVHCDVTWDTPYCGMVFFNYFNLSDAQIARDHYKFQSNAIPECPTDSLNYCLLRNCRFLSQSAFSSYVRSRVQTLSRTPILAQLPFAATPEAILAAVNTALHSCGSYPTAQVRINGTARTAVILAA